MSGLTPQEASVMEQRAARWSKPDRGSDHAG